MAITETQITKIEWVKHGVVAAGITLEVKIGGVVMGSYTVPVGKKFDGSIWVTGEVKPA